MTQPAGLLDRLDAALVRATTAGEIGVPRSLRLHLGCPDEELPSLEQLLALGDTIFGCPRLRVSQSGNALLCLWEQGQVATVSIASSPGLVLILTVLGTGGALHLTEPGR
ncbi:MAG: hypothetical protein EOP22_08215 [Hyphomicrobiales bacterium]|nr:MAG: hypothetical protein EOP22_08215 [Hyphomicrobiales bacterium]